MHQGTYGVCVYEAFILENVKQIGYRAIIWQYRYIYVYNRVIQKISNVNRKQNDTNGDNRLLNFRFSCISNNNNKKKYKNFSIFI